MSEKNERTTTETVVGFDLGHGETSVAVAEISWNKSVSHLQSPFDLKIMNKTSIPTAYAKDKDDNEKVGEDAFSISGEESVLSICFKKRPSLMDNNEVMQIQGFAKNVYEKILKANTSLVAEEIQVFIGCPSGWEGSEIKKYSEILSSAMGTEVNIMKESKAAIVYCLKNDSLKSVEERDSRIAPNDIQNGILILDFGSSTFDVTYLRGTDDYINTGFDLGASYIENTIFENALNKYREEGTYSLYEEAFNSDKTLRNISLLQCRRAKETFFTNFEENNECNISASYRLKKDFHFDTDVNKDLIESLLNKNLKLNFDNRSWEKWNEDLKLKEPVEFNCKNDIVESSWTQYCYTILNNVNITLNKSGKQIAAVILTGGASRMYFIKDYCKQIFDNSKIVIDPNPSTCISKGLATAGRADMRAEKSKVMLKVDIKEIMKEKYPLFVETISTSLAVYTFENIIRPCLINWRDNRYGYTTLQDMENEIKQKAENLKTDPNVRKLIGNSLIKWIDKITPEINRKIDEVFSVEYGNITFLGKVDIVEKLKTSLSQFSLNPNININSSDYVASHIESEVREITAICTIIALAFTGIFRYFFYSTFLNMISDFVKLILGDPKTRDYPIDKRIKYYNKVSENFNDMKNKIRDELEKSLKTNEQFKSGILDNIDDILRDSIDLAMRYASLEI